MSNARELRRLGMSDVDQHLGEIVSAIPAGRVTTYGALADAVGTSARYVGRFLGRRGHNLPWWRVVNAAGNPVPAARTEALQRLIDDGVALSSDGRVDLEAASWDPGQPIRGIPSDGANATSRP